MGIMGEVQSRRTLTRPRIPLLLGALVVLLAVGVVGANVVQQRVTPAPTFTLMHPQYKALVATIKATGQVEPARVVSLRPASAGYVSKVSVHIGDQVAAGALLVRFDNREQALRQTQAEAQLAKARAAYDQLVAGAAPPEFASALAQLDQAQGQLRQIKGSISPADLRAAQARVRQAEAQLRLNEAGPTQTDRDTAETTVRQAQVNLDTQRNQLSANKTTAQAKLEQAAAALAQAQAAYDVARQQWTFVQETGLNPANPDVPDPSLIDLGATRPNTVNDVQRQQYYGAYVQAQAALESAQAGVQSATVVYDNARQAEATGVQAAEEQLNLTRLNNQRTLAGSDAGQLAATRAQLAAAQADQEKMRGEQRDGALQSAQAAVALAESQLAQLHAAPSLNQLAIAQAELQNAQAALDLAQLAVERSQLNAPFAGVVAEVRTELGASVAPTDPVVVLADFSLLHVDLPVDEMDVAQLQVGQPVTLTLDALDATSALGEIASISPLGNNQSAVMSYLVRVTMRATDPRIRAGMTASATIVVDQKPHALVVPRRAVRMQEGRRVVEVLADPALCQAPPDQLPADPNRVLREIQRGSTNTTLVEITAGLDEDDCVYIAAINTRSNTPFQTLAGDTSLP